MRRRHIPGVRHSALREKGSRRLPEPWNRSQATTRLDIVRPLLRFWPDLRSRIGVYILVLVLTLLANGIQLVVPMITGTSSTVRSPTAICRPCGCPCSAVLLIGIAEAVGMWARRMIVAPVVSGWEITLALAPVRPAPVHLGGRSTTHGSPVSCSRVRRTTSPAAPVLRVRSAVPALDSRSSSSSARSSSSPCSRPSDSS
jgi:hypothetical protein